ncbi:MAG TPA: hypothetical protein VFT41_13780 [Gemmatimonadaceae bacterium]|nr:hypothetical protein [Gemmatimonadaceae bacterium]
MVAHREVEEGVALDAVRGDGKDDQVERELRDDERGERAPGERRAQGLTEP